MPDNLTLIAALIVPFLLFAVLRVNAAMVFLSVCLGVVLVEHVAPDISLVLGSFKSGQNVVGGIATELALLLAPVLTTAILASFSVHGRAKWWLNLIPAAATSMLLVLLVVPLLSRGIAFGLMTDPAWRILSNSEAIVVGVGAAVSLLFLWKQRASLRHHDKKRHH